MARPRSDDARRVMVAFRATKEQVARWRAAAGEVTLSDFLRAAADSGADFATWDPAAHPAPTAAAEPAEKSDYLQACKEFEDLLDRARAGDLEALDKLQVGRRLLIE